ncbi:Uncharacterised protein [Chromobacterium violaceum]|uniref:Uncharacterized protein n=1 Tax=Chromobacterium violaceum TaxID=536 RepID=A0A3S5DL95_CHRVL|nr:Uncharacterised protein [Chromobacterium violaceum]
MARRADRVEATATDGAAGVSQRRLSWADVISSRRDTRAACRDSAAAAAAAGVQVGQLRRQGMRVSRRQRLQRRRAPGGQVVGGGERPQPLGIPLEQGQPGGERLRQQHLLLAAAAVIADIGVACLAAVQQAGRQLSASFGGLLPVLGQEAGRQRGRAARTDRLGGRPGFGLVLAEASLAWRRTASLRADRPSAAAARHGHSAARGSAGNRNRNARRPRGRFAAAPAGWIPRSAPDRPAASARRPTARATARRRRYWRWPRRGVRPDAAAPSSRSRRHSRRPGRRGWRRTLGPATSRTGRRAAPAHRRPASAAARAAGRRRAG